MIQPITADARADIDADPAVEAGGRVTRLFERFPCALEQQPLLRVRALGLARGEMKELRVELLDPKRSRAMDEEIAAQAREKAVAEFHKFITFAIADGVLTPDGEKNLFRFGHEHGLTDEQITLAVQVISYFNYINRIADGLGVDPEGWMQPSPAEWRRRKHHWNRSRS